MGEHDQFPGKVPGEIVEVYRRPVPCPGRVPGEIVEVYRQPDHREVVERYSRALPVAHPHAEEDLPDLLTDLLPPPAAKRSPRPEEAGNTRADIRAGKVPLRQKRRRRNSMHRRGRSSMLRTRRPMPGMPSLRLCCPGCTLPRQAQGLRQRPLLPLLSISPDGR